MVMALIRTVYPIPHLITLEIVCFEKSAPYHFTFLLGARHHTIPY